MPRTVEDLEAHAFKFWPTAISQREQSASIVPRLIESQEKFIGILYVADATLTSWQTVLAATDGMPANLFLKHLIVLSDASGEKLHRYFKEIRKIFPEGAMTFLLEKCTAHLSLQVDRWFQGMDQPEVTR